MNSTYGKLGWAAVHDVSNYVTSNIDFLLSQFASGHIFDVEKINETYMQYSGIQENDTSRTNFVLASYITARGRL